MPALRSAQGREEFEHAREEGIVFQPQRGPRRILGEDGRVRAIELIGVKRTHDENRRFAPVYDPEITESIEADTVILAIGQRADLAFLTSDDSVELTPQGTVKIDRQTMATSAPGVFAGGDVAFGPRNLIDAIANGKRAALSIDAFLRGKPPEPEIRVSFSKFSARTCQMAPDYEKRSRLALPSIPLGRRTGVSEGRDKRRDSLPDLEFAGGYLISNPYSEASSANITPDPPGISYYYEAQFLKTIRTGKMGARRISSNMPWWYFAHMSDEDLRSVFAFLRTVKPVHHRVDNTEPVSYCRICGRKHAGGALN